MRLRKFLALSTAVLLISIEAMNVSAGTSDISDESDSAIATEDREVDYTEDLEEDQSIINQDELQAPHESKNEKQEKTMSTEKTLVNESQSIEGIALQSVTNVYESKSSNSKILHTYSQGQIFTLTLIESDWYEVIIYNEDSQLRGYIQKEDVKILEDGFEEPEEKASEPVYTTDVDESKKVSSIEGIALKQKTSVYAETSKASNVLRSYNEGHILKFREYNANWFEATVYLQGEPYTGFIFKEDVDLINGSSEQLSGLAIKQPVSVYERPTTRSDSLKDYNYGHILKYHSFSNNWYKATVYLNGSRHTGYISVSDVRTGSNQLPSINGLALKNQTPVYSETSKRSKILRNYPQGHVLKYRAYNTDWYIATVFLNGVRHTGYIHKGDVDNVVSTSKSMSAFALKHPVSVYEEASEKSNVLKSYDYGHVLKFKTFSSQWHEAVVYVNGKRHSGYIPVKDVGSINQTSVSGVALNNKTKVYSSTSKSSRILRSYNQGHILKYRAFNSDWYIATVILNGVRNTGYIYKGDVDTLISSPKTLTGLSVENVAHVYSTPSRNSQTHKSYRKGHVLKYRSYSSNWYEATVYVNGKRLVGYFHHQDVLTTSNRTVVLDAGHGGSDPGARANGIVEKNLNLDLAKRAQKVLERAGFNVVMTRSSDKFLELAERASIANNSNADLFISIHGNAFNGQARGVETFWYDKHAKDESKRLAEVLQQEVVDHTNSINRRVAKGNFHVIRETKMPSALLEVGFIDNNSDAANLKNSSFKNRIVDGIYNAIQKFLRYF